MKRALELSGSLTSGFHAWSFPTLARLLLAVSVVGLSESSLEARCGVQRWDVKTGKDAQAAAIDLSSPTPTTIAFLTDLTRFPPPQPWPPPNRIAPEETTFWTLDATLDMYKFENDPQTGDSDYHLVIKDDAGNTMVAEIPFPGCVQGSAWVSQITQARTTSTRSSRRPALRNQGRTHQFGLPGSRCSTRWRTGPVTLPTAWRSTRFSPSYSTQLPGRPRHRLRPVRHRSPPG